MVVMGVCGGWACAGTDDYDVTPMAKAAEIVPSAVAALPAAALAGWAPGEEDYDVGTSTSVLDLGLI